MLEKQRPGYTGELPGSQEDKAPHTVASVEGLLRQALTQCQLKMTEDCHQLRDRLPDNSLRES